MHVEARGQPWVLFLRGIYLVSHRDLVIPDWARWAGQQASEIFLSLPYQCWIDYQ